MAWATTKGFNFRDTTGYVTDGANETYVIVTDTYPTTRTVGGESVTFGWSINTMDTRNRNSGNDQRLAGIHFQSGLPVVDFRVDLPATGDYKIRCALGDPNYSAAELATIQDDATLVHTLTDASVAANSFLDATNVELTQANWPGSNAQQTETFASTIFRLLPAISDGGRVAHVELEQVAGVSSGSTGRGFLLTGIGR